MTSAHNIPAIHVRYYLKILLALLLLALFPGNGEAAIGRKGQIVAIYDKSVTIDIGLDGNARRGDLFLVYRGNTPLAVLKVANSSEKFSMCGMTSYINAGTPRVGDYVTPAGVSWPSELVYTDPPDYYPIGPLVQRPLTVPPPYAPPMPQHYQYAAPQGYMPLHPQMPLDLQHQMMMQHGQHFPQPPMPYDYPHNAPPQPMTPHPQMPSNLQQFPPPAPYDYPYAVPHPQSSVPYDYPYAAPQEYIPTQPQTPFDFQQFDDGRTSALWERYMPYNY